MLEFVADPAVLVAVGSVGGGMALKASEKFIGKRKTKAETSKPETVKKPTQTNAFLCTVWELRHREANPFLDENLRPKRPVPIIDMTVCADPECHNCVDTRIAIHNREAEARRAKIKVDERKAELERIKAKQLRAAAEKRAAELEARKYSYVSGMRILRPKQVPYGAEAEMHRDGRTWRDYIVWTWPSPKHGKKMFFKQPIDVENIEEFSGDGAVVLQWTAIYDPVTGEHLGDYKHTPDAGTEIRNPVEKMPNKFEQEKFEKQMKELNKRLMVGFMNVGEHKPMLMGDMNAKSAPAIGSRKAKR